MNLDIVLIIATIIICFSIFAYLVRRWVMQKDTSDELVEWLKSTNARIDDQNKQIVDTLQLSTKSLNERLDNAARFIAAVQKNIGEMSEIGRGMKELQDFLKSPKLRGNIGEHILKELLGQMLPKQSFFIQYAFKSGVVVDAAIKTGNGIIPVDSKFPMENFRKLLTATDENERKLARKDFLQDVKKHIDDISKKYILTEEGTLDYALMYIPSEAVYYEIVNDPQLFEYAGTKKVLPVSPTTFYAYLRAILMSFEGQKIEQQANKILQTIKAMQKDYEKVEENMGVLSKHINNAYNQMNNVVSSFAHLGQKLSSTSLLEEKETKQLELK